jgi:hypothetical protein
MAGGERALRGEKDPEKLLHHKDTESTEFGFGKERELDGVRFWIWGGKGSRTRTTTRTMVRGQQHPLCL